MDRFWHHLGTGADGNGFKTAFLRKRYQALVHRPVSDYGMDDCHRLGAVVYEPAENRTIVLDLWRFVLYSGRFVLHLEKQTIYPRHLALFCSKRYDNAFLCRALQLCSAVEKLILFWGGFVLARRQTPERRQDIKKSNDNQH